MKTSKDEETSSDSDEESETEEVAEPKAGPSPRGVKRSNPFFKPGLLFCAYMWICNYSISNQALVNLSGT